MAHVLQLMPCPAVHTEVEEDEVGPAVDRVVEDVDSLVGGHARGADVGGGVVEAQREIMPGHVGGDVHPEVLEQPVHHVGVAHLVLHDLGDHVLLLDARRLHDPGHVAERPRQLGVGLHGHEVERGFVGTPPSSPRATRSARPPGYGPASAPPWRSWSSPFHHPHRLPLAAGNGLRRDDADLGIEAQVAAQTLSYPA